MSSRLFNATKVTLRRSRSIKTKNTSVDQIESIEVGSIKLEDDPFGGDDWSSRIKRWNREAINKLPVIGFTWVSATYVAVNTVCWFLKEFGRLLSSKHKVDKVETGVDATVLPKGDPVVPEGDKVETGVDATVVPEGDKVETGVDATADVTDVQKMVDEEADKIDAPTVEVAGVIVGYKAKKFKGHNDEFGAYSIRAYDPLFCQENSKYITRYKF